MVFQKPPHTGPGDRIMVVVAHPDDAEFMCSGSVAKWTGEGREVVYVLCTSGDKGTSDPEVVPAELASLREEEQREVCRILGVKQVEFLRHEDGMLVSDLALRKEIVRTIRRHRPSAVVTGNPTRWSSNFVNHPDHRAAAEATLDAVFPSARDYHVFPDLVTEEGLLPHVVDHLYVGMRGEEADVAIDISETIEKKTAALKAHKSQIKDPGEGFDEFVRNMARRNAGERGMEYAETFKYFYLGPRRPEPESEE